MLSPRIHNFVSYMGALLVYLMMRNSQGPQSLACLMWVTHFARRSLESLFLFNYSPKVMPIPDSIQEFFYYWGFAWWICSSVDSEFNDPSSLHLQQYIGLMIWSICEFGNYNCHCTLASLSKNKGPKKRIDSGAYLFSLSSCPHYFFEISSWLGFNIATEFSLAGCSFMIFGAIIMTSWAIQKHERYSTPTKKTPIFPFVDIRPPRVIVDAL